MSPCLACAQVSGCTVATSPHQDHYEIHVTVANAAVPQFQHACHELGVKPIVLDLQLRSGGSVHDVMTSSTFRGTYEAVRMEVDNLAAAFTLRGFDVIRRKIETTPWNPRTPRRGDVPGVGYFEAHLPVLSDETDRPALERMVAMTDAHLSRNVFKRTEQGSVNMVTIRHTNQVYEDFLADLEALVVRLEEAGFPPQKRLVEYAIYDSHQGHDARWIES